MSLTKAQVPFSASHYDILPCLDSIVRHHGACGRASNRGIAPVVRHWPQHAARWPSGHALAAEKGPGGDAAQLKLDA